MLNYHDSILAHLVTQVEFTHRRGQHLRNKLYSNTLGLFRNNNIAGKALIGKAPVFITDLLYLHKPS